VALLIDDDLDDVGVVGVFVGCEGAGECGHGCVGVVGEALDELVDHIGFYFGFIALDVDNDGGVRGVGCGAWGFGFNPLHGFGESAGAVGVVFAGHHGFAAEGADGVEDALVVGGDDDAVERFGFADLFDDVADQRLAGLVRQRLAGEARGGVTGGDDGGGLHG